MICLAVAVDPLCEASHNVTNRQMFTFARGSIGVFNYAITELSDGVIEYANRSSGESEHLPVGDVVTRLTEWVNSDR